MKQTAVEWLCHQTELNESTNEDIIWAIKESKKIHKQQIIEAYYYDPNCDEIKDDGEQYYNETFKQQ